MTYKVRGYDKYTGEKKTIHVEASSSKEARMKAYEILDYPKVEAGK